jgi:hypothetical protein
MGAAMSVDFLDEVLGVAGAQALRKAIVRQPALQPLLVPRTIMAWVAMASRLGYEGQIPAHEAAVSLAKTENGYSGRVGDFEFVDENLYRASARVAVAMGVDGQLPAGARALDLERLGKSLDALVKAHVVAELKKAVLDPNAGYAFKVSHVNFPEVTQTIRHQHADGARGEPEPYPGVQTSVVAHGPDGKVVGHVTFLHGKDGHLRAPGVFVDPGHRRRGVASHMYALAEKETGKKVVPSSHAEPGGNWRGGLLPDGQSLWAGNAANPQFGKTEAPGTTAKPTEQGGALAPQAPSRQQTSAIPRVAKPAALRLSEAALCTVCGTCGGKPTIANGRLRTCICYRELGDVSLKKTEAGDFEVSFGARWDDEARVLFLAERARGQSS